MEPAHGSAGDSYDGDQLDWAAGGRDWRHEHHADFRDGADARDWSAQSDWRAARGCAAAIFARGGSAYAGWRDDWDFDWSGHFHAGAPDDSFCDFGGCGTVLRVLPCKFGSQSRSD